MRGESTGLRGGERGRAKAAGGAQGLTRGNVRRCCSAKLFLLSRPCELWGDPSGACARERGKGNREGDIQVSGT